MVGGLNRDTPLFLSRVIFYLWSSFHDYLSEEKRKLAELVDELKTEAIKGTVIPKMPTMLIPLDLALRPNGNLLAAFSMICVEFDSQFRIHTLYTEYDLKGSGIIISPLKARPASVFMLSGEALSEALKWQRKRCLTLAQAAFCPAWYAEL